jgi:hypothetical protein
VDVVDGAGRAAWIFEEAKHRRRPMELAAATEERGVEEEAAPELAD